MREAESLDRTKQWGGKPYPGLGFDFDPQWYLTDEQRDLQERLIRACHDVIRPQAIVSDQTGEYPWKSLEALAELGILGCIIPRKYGGRAENHVGVTMITESLARYGCPSTAVIFTMHLVSVAALLFRAAGNEEAVKVLRRIDRDCFVGSASYTDPETGGHFWYPKISSVEIVPGGYHVRKKSAFTTSSGYARWMITQTVSPDFSGDYSDLSVFLLYADELKGSPGVWDAMGMRGNQSGPVEIDVVLPEGRMIGPPGDGAASNDEAIDPLAMLMFGALYNGVALACMDLARGHATKRRHAQYGQSIADYATTHDVFGRCLIDVQASRVYAFAVSELLDRNTSNNDWTLHEDDPEAMPRTAWTIWPFKAKELGCRMAMEVSDRMLQLHGGSGYSRKAGIERLVRDAKAGWIMGPNNEITRQIVGRWALLGAEAADFWNQRVNEPLLLNELDKLDEDGKRAIVARLARDISD
ncbi:MAG: acyl-CoA/acyl-ACP dehydrogenase [Alphaproteobacteria bacterium]|nr:acyl-CoA/acyl-ACP dehydrogenase [Alphaproteobacteria bacterium]